MSMITVTCETCNKEFEKARNEYNRKIKQGKDKFYCNLSCAAKSPKNVNRIKEYDGHKWTKETCPRRWKLDEFSPFRGYLRKAKARDKEFNLTLEHLKDIWDSQGGKCPFTGFDLELRTYDGHRDNQLNIKSASLDRIDNSLGYEDGNVRFVSVMFNYARNNFSDEDVLDFAQAVVKNKGVT